MDWERHRIILPDTKAGETQTLTLVDGSLGILQGLPRFHDNPHIFPGRIKGQPLVNVGKAWRRIRKAAGVPNLRLHDIRRSVGSWMSQRGEDLNLIKQGLRHCELATTLIYARLGEDAARPAFERHGEYLMKIAGAPRLEVVNEENNGPKDLNR